MGDQTRDSELAEAYEAREQLEILLCLELSRRDALRDELDRNLGGARFVERANVYAVQADIAEELARSSRTVASIAERLMEASEQIARLRGAR